jgi:hypothetical protein
MSKTWAIQDLLKKDIFPAELGLRTLVSRKFWNKKKDFLEKKLMKCESIVNQYDYIYTSILKRSPG